MSNGILKSQTNCTYCGSRDNLAIYDDGEWCFTPGCEGNTNRNKDCMKNDNEHNRLIESFLPQGIYRDIPSRGLTAATCKARNYHYTKYTGYLNKNGESKLYTDIDVAVHDIKDKTGKLICQKIRGPEKTFKWINHPKEGIGILGKEFWDENKKKVILTEGIEDWLACEQVTDFHYNIGSLPNGAGDVEKILLKDYKELEKYEQIIIFFDKDEQGNKAVEVAKKIIPPYKLCIVDVKEKDACEILGNNDANKLKFAIMGARPTPPMRLIRGVDVNLQDLLKPARQGLHCNVFPGLDYCLNGFAKGELTIWAGGAKLGKTDALSRIEYELVTKHKQKIADIKVESSSEKNILQFISLDLQIPFKSLKENPRAYTEKVTESYKKLMPYFNFYKQSGRCSPRDLLDIAYYCHAVEKVDFIIIDNLTKAVSGAPSSKEGERKDIDLFMSDLVDFCQNTGVGVHLVVHLKNPDRGRSWVQGKMITDLGQMRGSGNIGNIGENIIFVGGQTRRYKDEDVYDKKVRWLGVLATREGREDRAVTDFYRLNEKTWNVELTTCPWEKEIEDE